MKQTVVIVEDEPDISELISIHLEKNGFKTKCFENGRDFFNYVEKGKPDLLILDLMLPDMDGIEICKKIRSHAMISNLPIIMLTARSDETDKILGLELGADDYVTKPFSPKELVARVKAVLRRHLKPGTSKKITVGKDIEIDLEKFEVVLSGKKIDLTITEFKILEVLSSKKGWVFPRDKILDHLWGDEKAVIDRTVDVHIRHLREKLGKASGLIKNVRGVGYKLEE